MKTIECATDWWKWGKARKRKALHDYPALKTHLENLWNTTLSETRPGQANIDVLETHENIPEIAALFQKMEYSTDPSLRLQKSLGKSYKDIISGIFGAPVRIVDAVVFPKNHDEVLEALRIAAREKLVLIPFGGGSNVVGDFELPLSEARPRVVLDLSRMNAALDIDEVHRRATFQAGIHGPPLEEHLNKAGLSLGHFPQSFEYSTLGGWIVTRSAGQESSGYGRIEDRVISLRAATPQGSISTSPFEGDASGVNIKSLFFGSEGTLGVVTEATVRIRPLPKRKHWVIGIFPSFEQGLGALKEIAQRGLMPSVVRFSDEHETFFLSLLSHETRGLISRLKAMSKGIFLKINKIRQPSLMMLRFDSEHEAGDDRTDAAHDVFTKFGALLLGDKLGDKWEQSRFGLPYLRDDLVDRFIVVDTMETVVPWDTIDKLRLSLRKELDACPAFNGKTGILLAHVSHVYSSCASLYLTVMTPMDRKNPVKQWHEIKNRVTDTIIRHGGAVSHHHGIGRDHQAWYLRQTDELTRTVLKNVKQTLDPENILNPGKLFDETK